MTGTVGVIANPAGINPPGWGTVASNKTFTGLHAEYVAGAAITEGEAVYLNTSLAALRTATDTVRELNVGVAITSAAAGEIVKVCHLGVTKVLCEDDVAAGVLLMRSGSTAGRVTTATATADDAEGGFLGVSLTAEDGNELWAFISPSFQRYNET